MTKPFPTFVRTVNAFAAAILLASCGPQSAVPPPSNTGAPKVVSLNPCIDAMLVDIALPEQILALSHYSRDASSSSIPAETARQFGVTGGTAEEILALQPDIVLASSFIDPATRAALERLDIRVATFGSPASVAESQQQIRDLGALIGQNAAAESLVSEIEQAWVPGDAGEVSTLLWQPGQIVPGETTLVSEVLTRTGFVSHSAQMGLGQADHVSLERILAEPPELLIVAGDSAGQRHRLLDNLPGMKVAALDPKHLYCGGRTIINLQSRLDEIRGEISA